jgi:hypothetical protein
MFVANCLSDLPRGLPPTSLVFRGAPCKLPLSGGAF